MSGYIQYTDYTSLLVYLQNEYPNGSIGWERVNTGLEEIGYNNPAMQNEFLLDSINRIPGYHAVPTNDGRVRLTYQSSPYQYTSPSQSAANATNSNASIGTNSAGKTQTYQVPAHAETNPQTGTAQIKNNLNGTTATKFITKEVVPAIAAAGVGITLGKKIDKALYDANPDFWDSHGMSSLNPDTWSSITDNMNDSLSEGIMATLFNMVFGIKPGTNQIQPYIDEKAFAYLALYEQTKGFFEPEQWDGVQPEGWSVQQPLIPFSPRILDVELTSSITRKVALWGTTSDSFNSFVGLSEQNNTSFPSDLLCTIVTGDENKPIGLFTSKQSFRGGAAFLKSDGTWSGGGTISIANSFTYDNKTVYYRLGPGPANLTVTPYGQYNPLNTSSMAAQIAWLTQYGNYVSSQLEGVTNQEGALLPNLTNDMTVDEALNALKEQYPELWDNAELSPQMQPDGSIQNNVYIPVAYPQAKSATDTQPEGDGTNSSQAKPYYDTSVDSYEGFKWVWNIIDPTKPDVPTDGDDDNDKGGGDSPVPIIPTGTAEALWKIYNPSQSQLDTFGAWLWSSNFVDQLLKLFNDPMQAIIGLHKVFCTPPTSGSGPIKVGYLVSDASANYVSAQYTSIDCGQVDLKEFFGNVFDYSPYTSIRLYLPFIGIVELDNDDVMRAAVGVKYTIDVLTGACLAEVKVLRDGSGGTLYTFSGNCAVQYPVSSGSYVGIVTGLLGIAGSLATGSALPAVLHAGASIGKMHADIKHSGNISANAGAMGIKKPYIIIERPQSAMPINGPAIEGLPNNKTVILSTVKGHAKIKKCHFDGIPCTGSELEKIEELLEDGIYIN
ncbi:MAG: hypothetical protein IKY67_13795 [Paludibacteraceae bacterium]|nr:hypothetical protein [Paludibacteraceae bacterium]